MSDTRWNIGRQSHDAWLAWHGCRRLALPPEDLEASVRALVRAAGRVRCRECKGERTVLVSPCLDSAENVYGPCHNPLCAALAPFAHLEEEP